MKRARIDAFMVIASEELEAAVRLEPLLPRQSSYFLSQSVEKMVRALIELSGGVAGTSHNLSYFAGLLGFQHPLHGDFVGLEHLSGASTSSRYPTASGRIVEIDRPQLAKDLEAVKVLFAKTKSFIASSEQGS
jgi:HEPN domain-containing protein